MASEYKMADILKILQFPVQISSIHSMVWSQNYRLAIATRRGVYVFTLVPDPYCTNNQINFVKDFVPNHPNDTPANPLFRQENLTDMSIELKNIIIQDRVLSPFIQSTDTFSHQRYVGWTPLVCLGGRKEDHYLITLSVDYSFRLFGYTGGGWSTAVDLSQIILNHIRDNSNVLKKYCRERLKNGVYEKLIKKAYLFATLCISWTESNRFVTGQEGGQVILWRLEGGEVEIEKILQPEIGPISAIQVQIRGTRRLIYIGSLDGRVLLISGSNHQKTIIWEEVDRLKVTKILEFETSLKNSPSDGADTPDGLDFWTLVICKSNFAISLEISSEKNSFKITNQSVLNAGISHVVGVEQLIEAVPAVNTDGKTAAHENAVPSKENCSRRFLVSAQKGPMHIWDGSGNKSEELKLGLERKDYATWGLCSSPNKAVFCLLECISAFNDHLLLREPARLTFFTIAPSSSIRQNLEMGQVSPDYLELFRTLFIKNKEVPLALDSIENLQSRWWLSTVLLNKHKTKPNLTHASNVEKVLRCDAAASVLISSTHDAISKLQSAKFIVQFCNDQASKVEANEILKTLSCKSWSCNICGCGEKEETIRTVVCESDHRWGRCGLTQQACDDPSYLTCAWCGSPFRDLVAETVDVCTLCSGPVR